MLHKRVTAILFGLVLTMSLGSSTGCVRTAYGPNLGLLGWPIPVSPFFQDELEDKAWVKERYKKVPILGPITEGGPTVALDPPSPDEVMRALEEARPVEGGLPLLHEIQRNNVRIIVEPIADYVDPPRVYPLLGPAQLHHAHYKCTIFFSEATRVGWPIPYTAVNQDAQEVVYVDHNHLHIVGNVDGGPASEY
ncbi:MAG: hypothetical protein ABFD16_04710 [Thermoguttaceae bacterium]|jgi:hypothetical protein